jgi:predicted amidohydrolase YtcJ
VRVRGTRIERIKRDLAPKPNEAVINAEGGCLLPALHDHHMHLMAMAAALNSEPCGPPEVPSEARLAERLQTLDAVQPGEWLRGIGYHPCVAGDIDRDWLDRHISRRPVRIQHRGGRLWVLNSAALESLAATGERFPTGMERRGGRPTGRLFEGDAWLRRHLPALMPDVASASRLLARYGIAGITDTTPGNGREQWSLFRQLQDEGALLQRLRVMGTPEIASCPESAWMQRGELKLHLLESRLPPWEETVSSLREAHASGRGVAIHCVTLTELVYALGVLHEAGVEPGDRIEHASVCPPEQLAHIRAMGLRVVTQPHFLAERGDQYIDEVEATDQPWLYRAAAFLQAGVPLAAGSDAPFGGPDPWRVMAAAVARTSPSGKVMSADEALTPEQALALYLSPPDQPGVARRSIAEGITADLCLLDCNWETARNTLDSERVCATWIDGQQVYSSG